MGNIKCRAAIALLIVVSLFSLNGCGQTAKTEGSDQTKAPESSETFKQVSVSIDDATTAIMDVPDGWAVDTSKNYATITPDDFDGMLQVGIKISPMKAFACDEEVLDKWADVAEIPSADWAKVSKQDAKAPIYETTYQLDGGKKAHVITRVIISGDYAIGSNALAAEKDWEQGRLELEQSIASFKVTNNQSPAYSSAARQNETVSEKPQQDAPQQSAQNLTMSQRNALESARSYISHSAFSHQGLIDQLEYEGYSNADATYGADNCGADWNAEALESAKRYIGHSAFSYEGLKDQLEYEGFTPEQTAYGADNCGADWFAEAVESAKKYLKHSSFSHAGLVDQLMYEGFTAEQAEHGVTSAGL